MATINLGNIKFNWKGTYNAGTAYAVDDVVSYNGSSYVCILASTGNLPTNTTYWNVMSEAGTDGTDLTSTLTTQGDILYRDGSGLARLGAGTSGQFLKTQGTGANPVWASNTAKLIGTHYYSNQQVQDLGNRYRSLGTLFNTNFNPVSTNSFFIVHASTMFDNQHHGRAGLQYSTDNSNWSYMAPAGATRSGANISWSSADEYKYPHMTSDYDTDPNSAVSVACNFAFAPSTPHGISTLYIRMYFFSTNSTNGFVVNRTKDNSTDYGTGGLSSIIVNEYAV
jgi:hypothetical protein